VRLFGEDMAQLRRDVFERSGGQCERLRGFENCRGDYVEVRCPNRFPLDGSIFVRMHLAHRTHGRGKRSDTLETTIASCSSCHFAEHGPRWSKKKMPKPWKREYFESYYHETNVCVCLALKQFDAAMCAGCRDWLQANQPALLHIIQNGTGSSILQGMSEFAEIITSVGRA
jgi:hypothetical protein